MNIRQHTAKQYRYIRKLLHSDNSLPPDTDSFKWLRWVFYIAIILTIVYLLIGCSMASEGRLDAIEGHSINQWANAIHKAEGNDNYGILSVKCEKGGNCRQICKNTVLNNYKRWKRGKSHISFLRFLQRRYCAIGCFNDPAGLNKNWAKNVNYWLMKG